MLVEEKLLIDDQIFDWLLKDIAQAKTSIELSTYIFDEDIIGVKIADALILAAKRGVNVRVLVDGVGTFWSTDFLNKMNEAGVQTRIYHPLPLMMQQFNIAAHTPSNFMDKLFYLFSKINSRSHQKFCVIDQRTAYVSSANIAKCHVCKKFGGDGWRDNTIRIVDIDTSYLEFIFNYTWNHLPIAQRIRRVFQRKPIDSIFSSNLGWRQRRRMIRNLINRINHAKHTIWITNAYFVPDIFMERALIKAAHRKVDVRILLPQISDVIIFPLVATTFYSSLLKNGIAVYEYKPSVLHAKTWIIDDWYSVGSSNLNSRSLKHDLEVDITIQTDKVKQELKQQFLIDLQHSEKISWEHLKKQSLFKKILGRFILFFRHWI